MVVPGDQIGTCDVELVGNFSLKTRHSSLMKPHLLI